MNQRHDSAHLVALLTKQLGMCAVGAYALESVRDELLQAANLLAEPGPARHNAGFLGLCHLLRHVGVLGRDRGLEVVRQLTRFGQPVALEALRWRKFTY